VLPPRVQTLNAVIVLLPISGMEPFAEPVALTSARVPNFIRVHYVLAPVEQIMDVEAVTRRGARIGNIIRVHYALAPVEQIMDVEIVLLVSGSMELLAEPVAKLGARVGNIIRVHYAPEQIMDVQTVT